MVRERIDPRLTGALFANYRTPVDAVLELVDNAVDSRVAGRTLELDLAVHPGRLVMEIVGGTGMSPAAIERDYLRWGASPKRTGDRIGRYGQGGKAAIGHLGNRFEIVASAAGDTAAYGFEDPAYRDRARLRTYDLHPRKKAVPAELGYVRIEIGEVDRKLDPRRLAERLAEAYRPMLEAGHVRMVVNRAPVAPRSWTVDERHELSVRAAGRLVRGWWGLLPDPPPPGLPEAGLRLYHLGRLVGAPEWFGHPTPAAHPALNRLVGEVELPHVPVTMNKADVDRGSEAWAAVEARLHALLAPAVRRLTREPASAVTPEAARTAEQVRRILAKALRLLEEGRLFESEVAVGGEEPGGQLALEGVRHRTDETAEPGADEAGAAGEVAEDPGASG
ncbi:MAG TPA: ATP-binding protein, partial [Desulfobacterales bacterium]|nr:ATP-binding protein [Desulfobacterales bacterium]